MSGIGGVIAEIGSFEKNLKFYEPITNPRIFFGVSPGFPKILAAISCKIVLILDFGNSKSLGMRGEKSAGRRGLGRGENLDEYHAKSC